MIRLPFLDPRHADAFPPVESALDEPDGLLAAGGDLSPLRLLAAYRRGIFPWYSAGEPILWWSPSVRTVFDPARMHVPRRLARWLRGCGWALRADSAFAQVMEGCAAPRAGNPGTWITPEMQAAYARLHALGHAHSVEAWDEGVLAGGVYGVALGGVFFGESMFSAQPNGSRVALLALARAMVGWDMPLLDAQVASAHLARLGASALPRAAFLARVRELAAREDRPGSWQARFPALHPVDLAG